MGRHSKQTPTTRHRSVLALTGLIPTTVFAANAVSAAPTDPATTPMASTAEASSPEWSPLQEVLEKPAADTEYVPIDLVQQQPQAAAPLVKTVAQPVDRPQADVPDGELGMPGIARAAYVAAEATLARENPECGIPWTVLAGIGRVESTHMYDGKADAEGNALDPVYGPVLDGRLAGNHVIHDSDQGALDGLGGYDRAVGPMQFLPETWTQHAADGNGDGIADPQNYFDAALTTGKYLCHGGMDLRDPAQRTRAILRYNHSMAYVTNVMAWANSYRDGVAPQPAQLPGI